MGTQKTAVVAGGSGGIGEGIVTALMTSGYRVYVPTRDGDHSDRLKEFVSGLGELRTIPADLVKEREVTNLRDEIVGAEDHIDAVVVSVGAYYYGYRMHRMPRDDFDRSIQDNLITHFNLQRSFVDLLRKQDHGAYVTLTGPESESIHPDEAAMSIMAAAQKMMTRVIAYESFDSNLRVHSITAHTPIKTRSRGEDANLEWITSEDLGEYVSALVDQRLPGGHEVLHELRNRDHVKALLKRARRRSQ